MRNSLPESAAGGQGVGINQALAALEATWDDVRRTVDPGVFESLERFTVHLHDAAIGGDTKSRSKNAYAIADLLSAALPPDHPFVVALESEDTRFVNTSADQRSIAERLFTRLSGEPPHDSQSSATERSAAEAVAAEAERRLAQTACVLVKQLRSEEIEASGDRLISLGPDGRLPRFQFDAALHPRPVVLTVNAILDAHGDPWGVADWWLGENAWLGAAPAALLGAVEDGVLVDAAEAELGEA